MYVSDYATGNISTTTDDSQSELPPNLSILEWKKLLTTFLLTAQSLAYHDIFALQDHETGEVDNILHAIITNDHPPIHQSINPPIHQSPNAKKC